MSPGYVATMFRVPLPPPPPPPPPQPATTPTSSAITSNPAKVYARRRVCGIHRSPTMKSSKLNSASSAGIRGIDGIPGFPLGGYNAEMFAVSVAVQ